MKVTQITPEKDKIKPPEMLKGDITLPVGHARLNRAGKCWAPDSAWEKKFERPSLRAIQRDLYIAAATQRFAISDHDK